MEQNMETLSSVNAPGDASFNLLGSLVAAIILAIVPYLLLRGTVNYIAGLIMRSKKKESLK